jgi:para-nitrobenzyl esterase
MVDTIATTTAGAIRGRDRDGVLLFAGIPYAAPPTGARRFQPPAPVEPWADVREAIRFGPVSWQAAGALGGLLSGPEPDCDEDCLTLNVMTPALDDGHRPVMVWIHGGGFVGGSGSTPWYDGHSFVTRGDVVVVTINYRLGALGFLHLAEVGGEAYASSGLSGILDQAAALAWVRDNAAAFGGDPDNVTIFGESAGAMSVGTLLGLPEAAGLFHRAIAQSGAAHNLRQPADAALVTAAFLESLGVDDLDGLLAATPQEILAAQTAVSTTMAEHPERFADGADARLGLPFQPVVDGVRLPRAPMEAVAAGAAPVPLMVGTNADEWNLFAVGRSGPSDDATMARRLDGLGMDGAGVTATYRRDRPDDTASALWSAFMTDQVFRIPAIRLLEAQSTVEPDHTFAYWFTWRTPTFDGRLGSCHALEIPFVFDTMHRGGADLLLGPDAPVALSRAMQDAWIDFARHGHPDPESARGGWPPYDLDRRATMEFGDRIGPLDDPAAAERRLWEGTP